MGYESYCRECKEIVTIGRYGVCPHCQDDGSLFDLDDLDSLPEDEKLQLMRDIGEL